MYDRKCITGPLGWVSRAKFLMTGPWLPFLLFPLPFLSSSNFRPNGKFKLCNIMDRTNSYAPDSIKTPKLSEFRRKVVLGWVNS